MSQTDLLDLNRMMGEANAKLDALLSRGTDHETRIRDLEASRNKALGMIAVVTAAVTMAWNFGGEWVKRKLS